MKLSIWCIALLIIANHAFAQGTVKISGKIEHPISDSVTISYNENRIAYYPKTLYTRLDKKGNFSFTLQLAQNGYTPADLVHGNKVAELVLEPGNNLQVTADAARFDSSIQYKGKGSEVANFVAYHRVVRGRMSQYAVRAKTAINKGPVDFLNDIAAEKHAELGFLHKNKTGLPENFVKFFTAFYEYYNYFFIEQYPQIHELVRLRRYTDTVPEANYAVLKDLPYAFDDSLLQVTPYLLYLTGVFDIKLRAAGYWYPASDVEHAQMVQDSVSSLAQKLLPAKSAAYFVAQNLYGRAKYQSKERNESQFGDFKKHWPGSEYLPMLDKQVTTAIRLAKWQPAPDIDITAYDGRKMKLSDLKGKVVYVTFWATWCKQCMSEMINKHRVMGLVKDKQVAFVYVSIDTDTAAARRQVLKYKVEGIFTNAIGGWDAKEVELYGVQSLPGNFLIDREGKFAIQNAPSLTQYTQLIQEIEKLFKD